MKLNINSKYSKPRSLHFEGVGGGGVGSSNLWHNKIHFMILMKSLMNRIYFICYLCYNILLRGKFVKSIGPFNGFWRTGKRAPYLQGLLVNINREKHYYTPFWKLGNFKRIISKKTCKHGKFILRNTGTWQTMWWLLQCLEQVI